MDYALAVGVCQGVNHVAKDAHGVADRQLPFPSEPLTERLAFHERHGVIEEVVRRPGGEERHDVGMLEARGELDLAAEPLRIDPGGELGGEDLDDDAPMEPALLCDEDATHPTTAELSLEMVRVTERDLQALAKIGQVNDSEPETS